MTSFRFLSNNLDQVAQEVQCEQSRSVVIFLVKVHIFYEGHKILRNLLQLFDWQYVGQIIDGDFTKFCDLLRIYEL